MRFDPIAKNLGMALDIVGTHLIFLNKERDKLRKIKSKLIYPKELAKKRRTFGSICMVLWVGRVERHGIKVSQRLEGRFFQAFNLIFLPFLPKLTWKHSYALLRSKVDLKFSSAEKPWANIVPSAFGPLDHSCPPTCFALSLSMVFILAVATIVGRAVFD